jgi:diguanylate cyclase (GGDEF)-like protein/PAS domain S-box-containing protein
MIPSLANSFILRVSRVFVKYRIFRYLSWLVLGFFLLTTYQLWKNAQNETEVALQTEFNFRALDASGRLEQRMMVYEHLLNGVQGLFGASQQVSRKEFHAYVTALNIEKNYPGIQSLGYTLLVPRTKKDQHIGAVRKEGFPEYTIRPDGLRDPYTSLVYIEPFSGRNLQAFGYDTYADPVRRAAMERARDTGLGSISARISLVQETDKNVQAGFLMWLPVYRNGASHNTRAERRASIVGWVGASFRMDDLMASIFDRNDNKIVIKIYDGTEASEQNLMNDAGNERHKEHTPVSRFQYIKVLDIAGHQWTMVINSLPAFEWRQNTEKPALIAWGGITLSVLLALITAILVHGRSLALQSAQAFKRELAERRRVEAGMRLAEKVFETVDAAVLVTDTNTRIIKVNPAFTMITGYSATEAIGHSTNLLSSGAHPTEFYKEMWAAINKNGSWQGEISNRRKNGEFYTEWLSINEVRDNDGDLTNYVALFSDISDRKAAEAHMHNLAHYDPLTGLPNRTLLSDRLQQAITAAKREKSHMSLMFVDLDKFKSVNDTLGHHIGDLLLKEVAQRVQQCLRESDSAARIGGDEFVVLLPLIETKSDAFAVAEKIRQALNKTFELAGHSLNISSSIGVAVYPEHGSDEKTLLRNADNAMYYAKEAGRNNVMMFEQKMERDSG